jgi:hypothetical protein
MSAMTAEVEALVGIVNTEASRAFTEAFVESPIRIGRSRTNSLCLEHPTIARSHGEISFGPSHVLFRNHAWTKASCVDGIRIKRGQALELNADSVITLGPFRIQVLRRTPWARRDDDTDKVTPLALAPMCAWNASRSLDDMANPYLAIETGPRRPSGAAAPRVAAALKTFASGFLELKRSLRHEGGSDLAEFRSSSELVDYLVDPLAPNDRVEALDEELTSIAARVALDLAAVDGKRK